MVQWDISGMCLHVFLTSATVQSYLPGIANIDCLLTMGRFRSIPRLKPTIFGCILCVKNAKNQK